MAKIRDLLVHVSVEAAKGARGCARNRKEHHIPKGQLCLCVKGGPRNQQKSYCLVCARDILQHAQGHLKEIITSLSLVL